MTIVALILSFRPGLAILVSVMSPWGGGGERGVLKFAVVGLTGTRGSLNEHNVYCKTAHTQNNTMAGAKQSNIKAYTTKSYIGKRCTIVSWRDFFCKTFDRKKLTQSSSLPVTHRNFWSLD